MVNLGTDIKDTWSFGNGDIELVRDEENLGQAILNRLRADTDTYDIFYARYGGELFKHLGDLNNPTIHEYIRIEIESIVQQDPRVQSCECNINKIGTNGVECTLKVNPTNTDEVIAYNFVISDDYKVNILNEVEE